MHNQTDQRKSPMRAGHARNLELARVIGHRDINSLLIYYRASASAMARKLG